MYRMSYCETGNPLCEGSCIAVALPLETSTPPLVKIVVSQSPLKNRLPKLREKNREHFSHFSKSF